MSKCCCGSESLFQSEFINFLRDELAISQPAIAMTLRHRRQLDDPLPMLLWQYGLVSLDQLQQIFDWLEKQVYISPALNNSEAAPPVRSGRKARAKPPAGNNKMEIQNEQTSPN